MKKIFMLSIAATLLLGTVYLLADDQEKYETKINTKRQNSLQSNVYKKECASCHMGYQPEFLPKRSWNKMMNTLEDHFGVDASVDAEDKKTLAAYLSENAADSKDVGKHYRKTAVSIKENEEILRISDTPYFKKEHRKIPKRYIEQKEVKSIANCTACHQKADMGDYRERHIFIPNYGKWDD